MLSVMAHFQLDSVPETTDTSHVDYWRKRCKQAEAKLLVIQKKKQEIIFFQSVLEIFHEATYKRLKSGNTDISTGSMHATITKWSSWKETLGQLIAYNLEDPKEELHAYFFGHCNDDIKTVAVKTLQAHKIDVYECVVDGKCCTIRNYTTNETAYVHDL